MVIILLHCNKNAHTWSFRSATCGRQLAHVCRKRRPRIMRHDSLALILLAQLLRLWRCSPLLSMGARDIIMAEVRCPLARTGQTLQLIPPPRPICPPPSLTNILPWLICAITVQPPRPYPITSGYSPASHRDIHTRSNVWTPSAIGTACRRVALWQILATTASIRRQLCRAAGGRATRAATLGNSRP